MTYRSLSLTLLLLYLAGPLVQTAGELQRMASHEGEAHHSEGSPCSDPTEAGHPCGPSCQCTCCPGPRIGLIQATLRLRPAPSRCTTRPIRDSADLHPKDVEFGIFRPPRR